MLDAFCWETSTSAIRPMDEALIAAVQIREPLWNPTDRFYKHTKVLSKLWEEVAHELQRDVRSVKNKWKNLRSYYMNERRKLDRQNGASGGTATVTWVLFDRLMFLRDVPIVKLEKNEAEESIQRRQSEDIAYIDEVKSENNEFTSENEDPSPPKRARNSQSLGHCDAVLEEMDVFKSNVKNDDQMFFESLLPYVRDIPVVQKLRLRSKIQDLISNELEILQNQSYGANPIISSPDEDDE